MGSAWILFHRLVIRPLWRDPFRTALTVAAVALGVAVVVAIDLAGHAAAGSFHSSMESLAGTADLTLTAVGGLDERLLGRLAQLPEPLRLSARVDDFATPDGRGAALPFLGLDLVAQSADINAGGMTDAAAIRNPIWVGPGLGWRKGRHVRLLINDRMEEFTVAGVLPARPGGNDVIVADIGLAQTATGKVGKLDAIDVKVPGAGTLEHWEKVLRENVPRSVAVEPAGARTDENVKMLAAFRWNLRVLSYIALVVGAFLIFNTIAVSVVRRRAEIGILRALGATQRLILGGFLAEAAFFGTAGGLLGLALGRLLALVAVRMIGNTVQALYVSGAPSAVQLSWEAVGAGFAIGLGMSLLSALAPASEASRVAPVEAMARGRREFVARLNWKRNLLGGGILLLLAGGAALLPAVGRRPVFGYASAVLLVAGTTLLIPVLADGFARLAAPAVGRLFGIESLLALRSLRGALNRTSVLVGALATAVAMMVSVGIMVGSFRVTVAVWMNNQLKADFFLRPAGSAAADRHPVIGPGIPDRIQRLPGVAAVDRFRVYPIDYDGLPASLGGGETSTVKPSGATFFLPGENRDRILDDLPKGDNVIVSEPFANKHSLHPGDTIRLPLAGAMRPFRVLGVYYDYSTERGFIVMDRQTMLKYLPDPAASTVAVYLKPDADRDAVRRGIAAAIGGRGVLVFSNAALRREALAIFDRTFRITWALEAVAIAVAVMGIAGALLALVLDRRREYALLRFLGASAGQVRRMILAEAGLLGLLSNVIGLALGSVLSLLLVYVINKQSFGWTIQFHWPVELLLFALTGVYLATFAAGVYPATTAVRMNPIEVVHEE